ncbi:S-adenosyl-L-methionine-dependent methyltransferase [Artemisia annua]|uniref:S-adenosyl-L-methionine-dependent methyltransferase n=1 Tax=Artemisia annua TaxID=35608 RepID=A0A2U1L349_ARTAN|nr:S-adenosyl-L-methionine-dependent methyltransferase [Artemisia annua]
MATGKSRGNKRSSGGSCSSTLTMVVLVTVCALGLWMLTSSSTPSSKTTPMNISDNVLYDTDRRANLNRKMPIDATQDKLVDLSSNSSTYGDNGGDLPIDVVQHDDELRTRNDLDMNQEMGQNSKVDENENKEENTSTNIVDDDAESLNDSDMGKQEAELHQEEAKEEQDIDISTVTEDNANGSKETTSIKKHNYKTRNSEVFEESTIADDQQSDTENQEDKQTEHIRDLEDNQERETNDQEPEKEMEDKQEEQENEDDGPVKSHSIAAETKAQVEDREARDLRNKMEQAKIESTIDNTTIHIKASNVGNSTIIKGVTSGNRTSNNWELCNVTAGTDYIPCLDNEITVTNLHHRYQTRHCPDEPPMCLVPLPKGYKTPIPWPQSRDKIWLQNVPNNALSNLNGHQNWVKVTGEFITFPRGALHYIDFLQEAVPEIAWGNHTRVVLDVGCGVASFGGYLFNKDVLSLTFASKDDQESQIQFALERGIPAISAIMGTQRLPFPSKVFDLVHCVRCRVPWHEDGGIHLLEVNRVLRPGGYFIWSATPVYQTLEQDIQIWKEMSALTVAMCWELVTIKKDKRNVIGVAIYRKPDSNECYNLRKKKHPPMCKHEDDSNASWYIPLQTCMHEIPMDETERGSHWPERWPERVQKPPYWLNKSQLGIYGKPTPDDFKEDYRHWKRVISKSYMGNLGINWLNIRNVMDMRAAYGGFAAALKDLKLWVLNVVNIDSPDTLPIIFERGLIGMYHDWCESFNTYPRTYDLLHADHLFSKLKNRCKIKGVVVEIDRILRPGGSLIARDESSMIREMQVLLKSLHWEVNLTFVSKQEGIISGRKSMWRPSTYVTPL